MKRNMIMAVGIMVVCVVMIGCEEPFAGDSDDGNDVSINAEAGSTVVINGAGEVNQNQNSDSSFDEDAKRAEGFAHQVKSGTIDLDDINKKGAGK